MSCLVRYAPTKYIFNCNDCSKETMVNLYKLQKMLESQSINSYFVCYQDPEKYEFVNKIDLNGLKIQKNEYANQDFDNIRNFYITSNKFTEGTKFNYMETFISENPKCISVVYLKNMSEWTSEIMNPFTKAKTLKISGSPEHYDIRKIIFWNR